MNRLYRFSKLLSLISIDHNRRKQVIICLCLLFLLLNITSLFFPIRKSITYDEPYHFNSGSAILAGKAYERGEERVQLRNIMPASALYPLVSKAIPGSIISRITGNPASKVWKDRIYLGKIATIFASLTLAIYVFRWSEQLYGIYAGFLGLSLYILDPNIIAHSHVCTQDIFGACSIFIATYYFWRFLKFGGRRNALLSMITFGIAQITRYTAIYLLPIYFLLSIGFYSSTIFHLIKTKNFKIILSGIKHFCTYTILLLLTAIITINIGFSFEKTLTKLGDYEFESKALTSLQSSSSLLRALPMPVPSAYLRGLDMGKYKQETGIGSAAPYLMGRLGLENGQLKGFKEYYLIAFLYKVPIATQLLLLMAIAIFIRYRHQINFWQNEAFLVIPSLFFFTAFSFTTAQLGIRYILMIFPFLFVLSGRAAVAWTALRTRYSIFVISLVTYLLISNLSYFPHYIPYFNELLIDRKMGYTILADSNLDWHQNKYYLKHYLQKHPEVMYSRANDNLGLSPERIFNPEQPQAGLVVISANDLVGITAAPKRFQWFRQNLKPIDHVAYSYLVFKINPQDLPQ